MLLLNSGQSDLPIGVDIWPLLTPSRTGSPWPGQQRLPALAAGEGAPLFDGTGHGNSDAPCAPANGSAGAQTAAEVNGRSGGSALDRQHEKKPRNRDRSLDSDFKDFWIQRAQE